MAKEKTAEKTVDLGCIYDFIPMIQEKLGGMCPREDVLREILNAYTTGLMKSINTALRFRYVEVARKFNPSLPTAQECYDFAKTAEEDTDEVDCDDFEEEFAKFLADRRDILPKGEGFSDLDLYRAALHFNGWQKRKLMKDAKSGTVQEDFQIILGDGAYIDLDPSMSLKPSFAVKAGERVKLIIIKED